MISVVIPLYNKALFIQRAIDSVIAQTITDWELIVVDDGSNDEGPTLVSAYTDPRIKLIKQANAGVSAARNKGTEFATYEIFAFLDADDYWAPSHLENLQQLIADFPDAALYGTSYFGVGSDGIPQKRKFRNPNSGPDRILIADYFADVIEYGLILFSSSVAIRRSRYQSVGGFPIGLKSGEDTLTWARLACQGNVAFSKVATAFYVLPPIALSDRRDFIRRPQTQDYVASELTKLRGSTPTLKTSLSNYIALWHRIRAMNYLELNERLNCFSEIWLAVQFDKPTLKDLMCCLLLIFPPALRGSTLAKIRKMRGRA